MSRRAAWVVAGLLGVVGAAWVAAAVTVVPRAPFGVDAWLPVPVACAGARCVTYTSWTRLIGRAGTALEPVDILTNLLTARAALTVGRRAGVNISSAEVRAAVAAIETQAEQDQSFRQLLSTEYQGTWSRAFRAGLSDLLLRRKLAAAGIADVWAHPAAPTVTIIHLRYRWDARGHRLVER